MQIERKAPLTPAKKPGGEGEPVKKPFEQVLNETGERTTRARTDGKDPDPSESLTEDSHSETPNVGESVRRRMADEEPHPMEEDASVASAQAGQAGANPQPAAVAGAENIEGSAAAATVQKLADEIVAVVGPGGVGELQVEVDSSVIDDLRISVSRDDSGELRVRLMTDSTQTTKLLQANLGQLSAALAARNVQTAAIMVTARVSPAAGKAAFKSRRERDRRERGSR